MSPEVTAAIIAASVGVLTADRYAWLRSISARRATEPGHHRQALEEQRKQLDKTLAAQSERLKQNAHRAT